MLPVFDTPSGLPRTMVNLKLRRGIPDENYPALVSTAEAATLQLEFRYLGWLTDNEEFWEKAERVRSHLSTVHFMSTYLLGHESDQERSHAPWAGVYIHDVGPSIELAITLTNLFLSADDGKFVTSAIRLGSRGDSYYEYLL